jgi:hypothetical protein
MGRYLAFNLALLILIMVSPAGAEEHPLAADPDRITLEDADCQESGATSVDWHRHRVVAGPQRHCRHTAWSIGPCQQRCPPALGLEARRASPGAPIFLRIISRTCPSSSMKHPTAVRAGWERTAGTTSRRSWGSWAAGEVGEHAELRRVAHLRVDLPEPLRENYNSQSGAWTTSIEGSRHPPRCSVLAPDAAGRPPARIGGRSRAPRTSTPGVGWAGGPDAPGRPTRTNRPHQDELSR